MSHRMMEKTDQTRDDVTEDKMYVTVAKEFKANMSTLTWALQNSGGKKVCIIHVHQPAKRIPTPMGLMPESSVGAKEVEAYREQERQEMSSALNEYISIAQKCGVSIEKLYVEDDTIENGIIQFIQQHKIEKLVMGAAADKHYSRKMTGLRSKKAMYVKDNAASFCKIWFVCKGFLIHTREAIKPPRSSSMDKSESIVQYDGNASPSAPPFGYPHLSPPRWSTESQTSDESVAKFGLDQDMAARLSLSSSMNHNSFMLRSESSRAAGLESLYLEECRRRQETEAELARVRAELEWMKAHVAEMPKMNEELESMKSHLSELAKVKAELDYVKNNVQVELRSAIEQKSLLENQIGNSTFILQLLGEKLASAINVAHYYEEQ